MDFLLLRRGFSEPIGNTPKGFLHLLAEELVEDVELLALAM
jgi:hypothetical protein